MTVIFRDLPYAIRGGRSVNDEYMAVASALRARPGDWAIICEGAKSRGRAYQIGKGVPRAYRPAGSFEGAYRARPDGTYDIYARYIGDAVEGDN